jgi:iron complex transport system permease protein
VKGRKPLLFGALVACLAACAVLALGTGAVRVPPSSILRLVLHGIGIRSVPLPGRTDLVILLYLRLPRVLSALLVGAALASCGAVMQGLFRNPMASPEVLGVSSGGSLGAVIAITSGAAGAGLFSLPLFTILGALCASMLIYALSSVRGATSLLFIVISGLAISSLFNGITSALLLFSREHEVSRFIFWTMGGLEGRTWDHVLYSAPPIAAGTAVLCLFARDLNLLTLGEQSATSTGVHVERTKRVLLAVCAALTGVCISVSGPIGFIGLLVPHLLRLLIGPDHRVLIPASALAGGLFLILCDLLARTVAPGFELRVGIVTAIAGSPYLLYLIVRSQRLGGERI